MRSLRLWLLIVALATCFMVGYLLGRDSVQATVEERIRIDTVFYEKPIPVQILLDKVVAVRVPRVLFAPGDTIERVVVEKITPAVEADSVEFMVTIERREYRDSTYRAGVSGPRVGDYGPSLDYIETYNRTSERVQTVTKRSRFAVTAGVGVGYTPRGLQPYIGVGAGVVLCGF